MAAANAHHRCGAVNLRSNKQSILGFIYIYGWNQFMHSFRNHMRVA